MYAIATLALTLFCAEVSFAQTPTKPLLQKTDVATRVDTEPGQNLGARKTAIETDLRDILSRLSSIYTRTQIAVGRLTDSPKIDTVKAQAELVVAGNALAAAKLSIDAFSNVDVSNEKNNGLAIVALKEQAKKSEDSLRIARTGLINALAELKLALGNNAQ